MAPKPLKPLNLPGYSSSHKSRGFVGSLTHVIGQTGSDLVHAGVNSAGALVRGAEYAGTHWPWETAGELPHLGKEIGQGIAEDFRHPLRHPGYTLLDLLGVVPIPGAVIGRAATIGGTVAREGALKVDLAAATRDALASGDVAGAHKIARSMGREGELSRAIDSEGNLKSVGRQLKDAIVTGAAPEERLLHTNENDVRHGWWYSRDPTIKAAQKLVDKAYMSFPNGTPPPLWRVLPPFWRSQSGRIRSAAFAENVERSQALTATGKVFWNKFKNLPDAEHLAARMVVEGTSAKIFRDYHYRMLQGGKLNGRDIAETNRRLALLNDAEKYLTDVQHDVKGENGQTYSFDVPELKPEYAGTHMPDYVHSMREIAQERDIAFRHAGLLSHDSQIARIVGPLHEMLHDEVPKYGESIKKMEDKLASVKRMHPNNPDVWKELQEQILMAKDAPPIPIDVAEKLITSANLARVPYNIPALQQIKDFGSTAFRRATKFRSRPSPPSTVTHPFQAGILKRGGGDTNTARVMAVTYTEAQRYLALHANWEHILASLQEVPDSIPEKYRVLVRNEQQFPGAPNRTQAERMISQRDQLTPEEAEAGGLHYEGARAYLFPIKKLWHLIEGFDSEGAKAPPGYGWADSRTLGGLDKQNPLIPLLRDYPVARGVVKTIDAVNTINKQAILYLKPAYIFPNALGNIALNLIQQGFMAPVNLGRSLLSWNRMKPDTRGRVLSAMGEGGTETFAEVQGDVFSHIQKTGRKVGAAYGLIVDQPFRISSFLHEARLQGYATQKELDRLVSHPDLRDQFLSIAQRANDEIINYERLGPTEQAILRRLVFFYPWIKGSTRYVATLAKNHPIAAGSQGILGKEQERFVEEKIGQVPSFLEGIFPSGDVKKGIADVQNPNSFSILGTPATIANEFMNLLRGTPDRDLMLANELSPSDRMLLDFISSGITGKVKTKDVVPVYKTAFLDYHGGNPVENLIKHLRNQAPEGRTLYPNQDALRDLSQFFLFGGLTKRKYDVGRGNYISYLQKHPNG